MSTKITAAALARDAKGFLAFKRAMGTGYQRAEFVLDSFVRFVRDRYGECPAPLEHVVTEWAARIDGRKAVTVGNEFGVVRQLCLFRRRNDPHCFVPDHALAPVKESMFVPYIFSREEVLALLDVATQHEGRSMWGAMLRALMLVMYCTGMRLGEAVRLGMVDVDLRRAILTVRRSKGRSRILGIRDDLAEELREYIRHREKVLTTSGADDPMTLFIRLDGSALTVHAASDALRCLLRELGLKPQRGRSGARPYELRHAFAVHRLTAWAEEGADVHAKLPWLSAYLGHQNVLGTEVYLKATPQLLQLASQRFEQHSRRKRRLR
jgi:integrase/recombinase XerD